MRFRQPSNKMVIVNEYYAILVFLFFFYHIALHHLKINTERKVDDLIDMLQDQTEEIKEASS